MPQLYQPPTEAIEVYSYDELDELVKANEIPASVLDDAREHLTGEGYLDYEWYDCVFDMWRDALDQVGFEDAEIHFSGFCSQGDGASFTASVNLPKLVDFLSRKRRKKAVIGVNKRTKKEDFLPWVWFKLNGIAVDARFKNLLRIQDYLEATVTRSSSHYYHENTCKLAVELHDRGNLVSTNPWVWKSKTPKLRKLVDDFEESAEELRRRLSKSVYISLEDEHEYLHSHACILNSPVADEHRFDRDGNLIEIDPSWILISNPSADQDKESTIKPKSKSPYIDRLNGRRRIIRE